MGDKLTAFAPHTTGIPFGVGKELEIIKQMYDIATIIDVCTDFPAALNTFRLIAFSEAAYRGIDAGPDDILDNVIRFCASIASRGYYDKDDYAKYLSGIPAIANHIIVDSDTLLSRHHSPTARSDARSRLACSSLMFLRSVLSTIASISFDAGIVAHDC